MAKDTDEQWPYVITVRINDHLVSEIDKEVGRLRVDRPGMTISISDAVRTLILEGLKHRTAK